MAPCRGSVISNVLTTGRVSISRDCRKTGSRPKTACRNRGCASYRRVLMPAIMGDAFVMASFLSVLDCRNRLGPPPYPVVFSMGAVYQIDAYSAKRGCVVCQPDLPRLVR